MPYVLITPPAEEPLSLAEAQEHLRLEADVNDSYTPRLILAARRHVEMVIGRSLITQTWELVLDGFPVVLPFGSWCWPARGGDYGGRVATSSWQWVGARNGIISIDQGQVQSVSSIKYLDTSDAEQTLATSAYTVDADSVPARVVPVDTWPETSQKINAVRLRFDTGYGAAATVPEDIKAAMLLIIGHLYEHRELEIVGAATSPLRFALEALLSPYRIDFGY